MLSVYLLYKHVTILKVRKRKRLNKFEFNSNNISVLLRSHAQVSKFNLTAAKHWHPATQRGLSNNESAERP